MPTIFEIFGYRLDDHSVEAYESRRNAHCPFMNRDCDGGGNRYLSDVTVAGKPQLEAIFPGRKKVRAGVCSLQLTVESGPWIVCPRRLLTLNRTVTAAKAHQGESERTVLGLLGYKKGTKLGVWPEVKIKYKETIKGAQKRFDYTFDYILMPIGRASQTEVEEATGKSWAQLRSSLESSGYAMAKRGDQYFVEDFPVGTPSVVEIMTSSTSGGDKSKRTTISMAFEDAMLGYEHKAPGVNYRQVWARMVSQLIVKSEVGLNWGGKTVWLVQDVLVNYICASTALDIRKFVATIPSEVNMLSLTYGNQSARNPEGVIELFVDAFFSGPISSAPDGLTESKPSFQDMIRAPMVPDLWRLVRLLANRQPANRVFAS